MSQLSFADVFNLARETADNSPVIQAGQQIAETVPTVHRMMSEQYSRGRFIRVFKDTGRHLGRWEVFSDFLSLAASELDMARIRTPESMEHCRKICARYEAADIANMQEMFCLMVCALEAKFHDFLGAIFMELELGDNFRGQYFTPYSVQCLMARMLMPGVRDTIRREGIATVSDPACGAAGMLIAYAECLLEADINPSMHMFGSCIDIDPVAADNTPQTIGTLAGGGVYGSKWFADPAKKLSVVTMTTTALDEVVAVDIRNAIYSAFSR